MSKFGWSFPAGCGSVPGDNEEPLIKNTCPNCHAVDIDWRENKIDNAEYYVIDIQQNPDIPEWHSAKIPKCPYCEYEFDPAFHDFGYIYSDDFADNITSNFPEDNHNWTVLSTEIDNDWHKVEIGFSYEGREYETVIEILVNPDDGQILYEDVNFYCKQILEGVKLAYDPSYLFTYTEPSLVQQGYRIVLPNF